MRKLEETKIDTSFHFLPALESGEFHDFIVKSRSGKEFRVHKSILGAEKLNTHETYLKSILFGFSDDVTATLLHYLYSQSLPENLSPAVASQVKEFARNQPNFGRLGKLCESYIKHSSFQAELVGLVKEMREALNNILSMFGGKTFDEDGRELGGRCKSVSRSLASNPAKLVTLVKQSFASLLLVLLKVIQFCEKFIKFKTSLSREDRNQVFIFAKAQVPLFMEQIIEIYKAVKYATVDLDAEHRHDIAAYIIPEIEELMSSLTNIGLSIQVKQS